MQQRVEGIHNTPLTILLRLVILVSILSFGGLTPAEGLQEYNESILCSNMLAFCSLSHPDGSRVELRLQVCRLLEGRQPWR